jgi:hypothetical protein
MRELVDLFFVFVFVCWLFVKIKIALRTNLAKDGHPVILPILLEDHQVYEEYPTISPLILTPPISFFSLPPFFSVLTITDFQPYMDCCARSME